MLSHLEEKVVGNYRSNQKNKERYVTFCSKKSNNSDNALQVKPTFCWIKDLLTLKKVTGDSEYTLANDYFIEIWWEKTFENSQRSVFRVINFRENVQHSWKLRKFLPTKVYVHEVNCFFESFG